MRDFSLRKPSLKLLSLPALLPLSLLISGCGMGVVSSSSLPTADVSGKLLGGRTPISGAVVSIYAVGDTGYGSAATQIGSSVTTTGGGSFQFPTGTLSSCASSTPNTPIYLLSVGGNAGGGVNSAAVLGASLGTCGNFAPDLLVNEITTTALAFSMSHFFPTIASGVTDTFGGPTGTGTYAPYAFGLGLAAAHTAPSIVNVATGTVVPASSLITVESAKIYSIGNALAACVDSSGPTSTQCKALFTNTTAPGSTVAPADTLQAAVNMALYPYQNVSTIFNLGPANGAPYVGLSTAPADWTIGVSYTSSAFGLELNAQTLTTIDIDGTGKVWFPSNVAGAIGVGNFDPSATAFNGPYKGTGLVHPQQVAIDNTGFVWVNDNSGPSIFAFPSIGTAAPTVLSIANTVSTAITVNDANAIDVGIQNTSNSGYYLAMATTGFVYSQVGTTAAPNYIQSITSDSNGSNAVSVLNASAGSATADYVVPTTPTFISTISSVANDPGQIIFTGSNYILAIPQSSTAGPHDSICIFGSTCSALASAQALSPYGMAIDGDGALWMADAGNTVNADSSTNKAYAGAQTVPLITAGTPGSYVGTGGTAINHAYFHGTGNGATAFTPYGIAIDNSGNVWMSNVGCVITAPATSCTPGSFVLTELIGAAAPTITPVSTAIVGNNNGPGTRP